jgi:hypothetical protein
MGIAFKNKEKSGLVMASAESNSTEFHRLAITFAEPLALAGFTAALRGHGNKKCKALEIQKIAID